jgi:Fe-S oxidoreductase
MAGSFGYEANHYEMSMDMGEQRLFPTIRPLPQDTLICASGFSCRHQINDGTGRKALHPAQLLVDAIF